jgi:hypothetical protein
MIVNQTSETIKTLLNQEKQVFVKLNESFKTPMAMDKHFIVEVANVTNRNNRADCKFRLHPRFYQHNTQVAQHLWYDDEGEPTLNYFEAIHEGKGQREILEEIIVVKSNSKCFDILEEHDFENYESFQNYKDIKDYLMDNLKLEIQKESFSGGSAIYISISLEDEVISEESFSI